MKIKIACLMMGMYFFSCGARSDSTLKSSFHSHDKTISNNSDTIRIDTEKSIIHWKGTKMRGMGKHEGSIKLKSGYLIRTGLQVIDGAFVIDMESIEVTDIPEHEPIPRKNLIEHLKSDDFFNVNQFPDAVFTITSAEKIKESKSMFKGLLAIRGITNPISFEVNSNSNGYHANIILDRFKWNIAYEGNWIDRTLVDRDMKLDVVLKLK